MKFIRTPLVGAYVIELESFNDDRGFFTRTFCQEEFNKIGFEGQIVQINDSLTRKRGTVRGLHYQIPPASEIKIIRCIQGKVFDVMVDLRSGSHTFMKWYAVELSEDNFRMVYIPQGFAHGFQTLADNAELIYHHSDFYRPEFERGIRYNDPFLTIQWPLPPIMISLKDRQYMLIDNNFKGIEL